MHQTQAKQLEVPHFHIEYLNEITGDTIRHTSEPNKQRRLVNEIQNTETR